MDDNELLSWGHGCEAAGEHDQALQAYQQLADRGNVEGWMNLGELQRKLGRAVESEHSLMRAEQLGHSEAAACLGVLLCDLGEHRRARQAYERAIEAGSSFAALNLGLMLAQLDEHLDAIRYLTMARDNGDDSALWPLGRMLEATEDLAGAADAFRAAAETGDRDSSFDLGRVLHKRGDPEGALSAFKRAVELGHPQAQEVVDQLLEPAAARKSDVSDIFAILTAVVRARFTVGRGLILGQLALDEVNDRASALGTAHALWNGRYAELCRSHNAIPSHSQAVAVRVPILPPDADGWLGPDLTLARTQVSAFEADLRTAGDDLQSSRNKLLGGGLRQRAADALGRVVLRLDGLKAARDHATMLAAKMEAAMRNDAAAERQRAFDALGPARQSASSMLDDSTELLRPWTSPRWTNWSSAAPRDGRLQVVRGGTWRPKPDANLGPDANIGGDIEVPMPLSLHQSYYILSGAAERARAGGFIRSLMLRHLIAVDPGEVTFTIFDPVGLGQSIGDLLNLADYDPKLIGGKVWTAAADLNARLVEHLAHIELVIQKYLRTSYNNIDDFNAAAGQIAEPHRVLVILDFPEGMTEESAQSLRLVAENGPRCGVFTYVLADPDARSPHGVDQTLLAESVHRLNLKAGFSEEFDGRELQLAYEPDYLAERSDVARHIVATVGRGVVTKDEGALSFDTVYSLFRAELQRGLRPALNAVSTVTTSTDPTTWWQSSSSRGIAAPIGQKGAREAAILLLDSSDHSGALLVGRPGSGKSTLLHSYIAALTSIYGPEELELYLIDFKEGVEFKAYAEHHLPHARVIAVESDRAFGLSVLESIQAEMSRRAALFRSSGGSQAGIESYRHASSDRLPRVLLIFDEFQVLFSRSDRIGLAAADALESIVRQGRGFGVHVLLGSQSLAGLDALGTHVPQLLPVRVLLPASESDAHRVLGDNNTAGQFLSERGEGILNPAGGAVEANERFKGSLITEEQRIARLQQLRRKSDAAGFLRRPVVFEGNAPLALDATPVAGFLEEMRNSGRSALRLRTGTATTIGDVADIELRRESGANVLAILRSGAADNDAGTPSGIAHGLLIASVAAAACTTATIDLIDFLPPDDGVGELLTPLVESGRIRFHRRRGLARVLEELASEVANRVDQDDTRRNSRLLFLFGLHRAKDLDVESFGLDADPELADRLEAILRDGPEVGIHVWIWSESVVGAGRRLTPRMMREISWRVAGRLGADDSHALIGSDESSGLRDSQLLVVNEERGISRRLVAFAPPTLEWLTLIADDREVERT